MATPAVFISFRPPIDPVRLVRAHFEILERTAVTHTRYATPFHLLYCKQPDGRLNIPFAVTRHALRFSPVSDSCPATLPDIIKMAERLLPEAFAAMSEPGIALKVCILLTPSTLRPLTSIYPFTVPDTDHLSESLDGIAE